MSVSKSLLFLLLLCQTVLGQQLQFENMGTRIALPSQESYNVMQDSKGYIWFSTEQGFCRYDGNETVIFDRSNGLPEGAVYSVAEDRKGRLWLLTAKNRILIFENGKLREASFSKKFQQQNNREISYSLSLIGNSLYIGTEDNTYLADIETGKFKTLPSLEKNPDLAVMEKAGRLIALSVNRVPAKLWSAHSPYHIGLIRKDGTWNEILLPKVSPSFQRLNTYSNSGGNFFTVMNQIVKVSDTLSIHAMPKRVLCVQSDRDKGLWIGMIEEGLYYFKDGDLSRPPVKTLKGYSVSGLVQDTEGNIWCTTLEKGVFRCLNKNVVNFGNVPGLEKNVNLLKTIDGITYCSSQAREMISLGQYKIKRHYIATSSNEMITDILKVPGGFYIGGKGAALYTDTAFANTVSFRNTENLLWSASEFKRVGDRLFGLSFGFIVETKGMMMEKTIDLHTRSRCFEHYKDDLFLFASGNELRLADIVTQKTSRIPNINANVTKILKTVPETIWIATKGDGLYLFSNGKAIAVNEHFGIKARMLYDILKQGDNLWIGSNEGLLKVSLTTRKVEQYDTENGLPSNEVYKLSLDGNRLFLSTLEGVCALPINAKIVNDVAPGIYLNQTQVNGFTVKSLSGRQLDHRSNSFSFAFDVISFKGETRLRYKLEGRDDKFSLVKGNRLSIDNLEPGDYKFVVYALNNDGLQSKAPVEIKFSIAKPFWQEIWFLLLCIGLSGLLVYAVVLRIISNVRIKEAEKTRVNQLIANSRLSAIQAQMNPHFIFNAINSIQNYILKKKDAEAYDYLAKFSKLIRLVLLHSQKQLLTLHEELETLGLYVELEQLRFDNSFDFVLSVPDEIDTFQMLIPTMVLQPYVENAIWHGLMNLEGQRRGRIEIGIGQQGDKLLVTVTDNGAGRKKAMEYGKTGRHESIALKLMDERLEIINKMYSENSLSCEIEDLFDQNGQAAGTRIKLCLPILNHD